SVILFNSRFRSYGAQGVLKKHPFCGAFLVFWGFKFLSMNLFDDTQPRSNSNQPLKVVDSINHSGLGKVWFAGRGIAPEWQIKREMLSPAYTTRWNELLVARL
ncbi:DUF4113 domain-containing protein, partial [Escherichia coli]